MKVKCCECGKVFDQVWVPEVCKNTQICYKCSRKKFQAKNLTEFWKAGRYHLIDTLTGKETVNEARKAGKDWLIEQNVKHDIHDLGYIENVACKIWSSKKAALELLELSK